MGAPFVCIRRKISAMSLWQATSTFYKGETVSGSDNVLYISQTSPNTGHNPVGDAGTNWKPAYASTAAVDQIFNTTAAGPVILDQSNGHTYRIKVTNGTLGVTQVT